MRSLAWKNVTIIGGYGRMGRFLARLFSGDGFHVTICGRRLGEAKRVASRLGISCGTVEKSVKTADLVIVSVPITKTYEVCKSIAGQMMDGSILMEIASVKTGITDRLRSDLSRRVSFVSIHPLFGPGIRKVQGRNMVVIKDGDPVASKEVADYFRSKGVNVTLLSVEEHDRAMATIQVLHHFSMTSLSRSLQSQFRKNPELQALLTDSLKLTMKSIRRILKNRAVVKEIQERNPYAEEARSDFANLLSKLAKEKAI